MDKGKSVQRYSAPGHPTTGGAPGQPGRPRTKTEEMTDLIDTLALEVGDQLVSMSLQALMDGMRANDLKVRLNAAKAVLNTFHHPSKQIDMNVTQDVSISAESRDAADNLTEEERRIVSQFEKHLLALRPDVVDAEVVEVVDEQLPELPPDGSSA